MTQNEIAKCELCGEPMPPGEEMFKLHGYSGPCPKPPLPRRKFRKKPVVIEAVQFVLQDSDPGDVRVGPTMRALEELGAPIESWRFAPDKIQIPTLEGTMEAQLGDWIIKGVAGEFYPCKPDIFDATYEPA